METVYYYKLTVDDGGAPCVRSGLLSLAICKPMIRVKAAFGSTIFGFAADELDDDNPLIYIAVVTGIASDGSYYRDREFGGRADRIYAYHDGRYEWRPKALFHGPNDLRRDLGVAPAYLRARVLLSSDFKYFGANGKSDYKTKYPRIRHAVEMLGQGHRVNHPELLRMELLQLKAEVWKASKRRVLGRPWLAPDPAHCHRERSCGTC